MKKCYPLAIALISIAFFQFDSYAQCDGATGASPGVDYVVVWEDDFTNNGAVCSDNWFHQTQPIFNNGQDWSNQELQHYTNSTNNSEVVNNDFLQIIARYEPGYTQDVQNDAGNTITVAKDYTSARLNSKFAFTYGKVDVRAKIPSELGTWPAIWMLGQNLNERGTYWQTQGFGDTSWPTTGEIDIMEQFDDKTRVDAAIHTRSSSGATVNKGGTPLANTDTEFHVYTVEWDADKVEFSVDGNAPYYTYNPTNKIRDPNDPQMNWPFDEPQFILLNIAMGGIAVTDPTPGSFTSATMEIDYVRVSQKEQVVPATAPTVAASAPT
ncbi:MAG: glycoside hydrolase family 16 protein, partial [Cyclobacteriaceae bacterium]